MTTSNRDNQAAYRRVAILRPGQYIADDGQPVSFSAADLARLAENYDPHYHCAPVNIDHEEHGPALGLVGDLVFDGEYLAADLTHVPAAVADALDAGRYPGRSAEIYQDLDGRGPYLRAVALLGARPPAVKGLPPLPPRVNDNETEPTTNQGRALSSRQAGPAPRRMPHVIHVFSEVRMRNHDDAAGGADPAPAHDDPAARLTRLAEDNRRLADENRRLKLAERRREAALFVASLREAGRLTPAMEQAGLEEALAASQDHPSELEFPDGRKAPLNEVLREIFSALPACCPLDAALDDEGEPDFELSVTEKSVAQQLGLSEREYAEIAREG
ncbi:hypothetical protein JW859_01750 [bacterium]|nr:hypothetical protein [bacterium]